MAQPALSDVHITRAITDAAIRYSNELFIADQVAPVVPVKNLTDKYFVFDRGDWFRDGASIDRRPGAAAPRGGYEVSNETYVCKTMAMASNVPDEIVDNADEPLRPFEDASEWCMHQVLIRRERQASANLFISGTWNAGTDWSGTQWSDFENSDPAADISAGIDAVITGTGFTPNTLTMGMEVISDLKLHPEGLDRFNYTPPGIMTTDLVAEWLGVEKVIVGKATYNTAEEDATEAFSQIWGKHALLSYQPPSPSITEPSAAYIFEKTGLETSTWYEDPEHQSVVEVSKANDCKRTSVYAGYYFPSVVA